MKISQQSRSEVCKEDILNMRDFITAALAANDTKIQRKIQNIITIHTAETNLH